MVYTMAFRVNGGCRNNGQPDAIAAASCRRYFNRSATHKRPRFRTTDLPAFPPPTNQRAEITALILALEWALERHSQLDPSRIPKLLVTIYSDSQYAVGCMTEWIDTWEGNGWINSRGKPVQNRDLIEEAARLEGVLRELGRVRWRFVPKKENTDADGRCKEALDRQE